jgi:hypothetical protein
VLGSGQCGSIAPHHFGSLTGTEQPLQCLALVWFRAQRMHAVQERLAAGKNIA